MRRALLATFVCACSGANATIAPPPDAAPIEQPDAGSDDAASGSPVNETGDPGCHDLAQRGDLVTPVPSTAPPPPPDPLSSLAEGLYVVTSAIDYGGDAGVQPPSRTTVFFTSGRQYYTSDDAEGTRTALTFEWELRNGRLSRSAACPDAVSGRAVEYRIDASPNGFTIFVPAQVDGGERLSAFRYERRD